MGLTRHSHFIAHASNVKCLRFGHKVQDRVIATGGSDHLINLWKMRENDTKKIMSLSGHQSAVESLVFDPMDCQVVAGSQSGAMKVFDLEAGKASRTLKGHTAATTTADYHLYGDYVASGSLDTVVKVWDLHMASCMQTFQGHSSKITVVSFTPDGRWLTSGDQDGVIKIWDLTAGRLLHEFTDHGAAVTSFVFNPEEFILASSAADHTIRYWDVQNFAAIGVTPVDTATTTSMCHTVTEPYCGKYLFSCSHEAIRVWSYESGIECHDSIVMPRQEERDCGEIHADTKMTNDMKLMTGCIEDAFVSIWELDVMQMRPFHRSANNVNDEGAAATKSSCSSRPPLPPSGPAAAEKTTTRLKVIAKAADMLDAATRASRAGSTKAPDFVTRAKTVVLRDPIPRDSTRQVSTHQATSEVFVPHPVAPTRLTCCDEDFTKSADVSSPDRTRTNTANSMSPQQLSDRHTETHETDSEMRETDSFLCTSLQRDRELAVSDFVTELRSGMDTCIKAFKARQKCVQQLLVHWKKGYLINGLQYIGELPKGKRAAVVVDTLRIMDLSSAGVDLEACTLLLPLILELLESKFELYLSVGIVSGQKLLNVFAAIVVKDSRDVRLRAVGLAGDERDRARQCDTYFHEMHRRVRHLAANSDYEALRSKLHPLAQALDDFYRR